MHDLFPQEKWLRQGQIASYWSRLARIQRQEALDDLAMDDDDENNQSEVGNEEDLNDDPYHNNPEFDVRDAIDSNAANIFARN